MKFPTIQYTDKKKGITHKLVIRNPFDITDEFFALKKDIDGLPGYKELSVKQNSKLLGMSLWAMVIFLVVIIGVDIILNPPISSIVIAGILLLLSLYAWKRFGKYLKPSVEK